MGSGQALENHYWSATSIPERSPCGIFALGADHRIQGLWLHPTSGIDLKRKRRELSNLRQEGQEGEPILKPARNLSLCPAPFQPGSSVANVKVTYLGSI